MIKWLVHLVLGRLASWMVRRGWLSPPEAARAEAAVEALVEIGEAAAKKPPTSAVPVPMTAAELGAAAREIARQRGRSEPIADDFNAASAERRLTTRQLS